MHGTIQKGLRYGAALVLAMALCATAALAAGTEGKRLVPVGHTVGVKLFARGVVVVKLPEGGTPARTCGLKTGDVIVECGGEAVTSTEQFQSLLQKNGTDATALEIKRQGSPLTLSVEPERNEQGICCIGAWIRDSMAGIGTVTYYDPATGAFGALGHGITDGDTMALMPFGSGSILPSTVKAVKKGSSGSAGELRGNFDLSGDLGPCAPTPTAAFSAHFRRTAPLWRARLCRWAMPWRDRQRSGPMCPGTRCGSMPLKF